MATKPIPEAWVDPIEQYVNFSIVSGQSERTIELREYQMSRFARAHPDGPASVTSRQVLKWVARTDLARNTLIVIRNALTSFYRHALAEGLVTSDPTASLPPLAVIASDTQPASRADFREALAVGDPRQKLLVRLGYEAGMTAIEIATLRQRDIQDQDGDYVARVQSRAGTVRLVPLPPTLAEDLIARGGDYLFAPSNNKPWSPAYVSRRTSKALPEGVSNVNLVLAFNSSGASQRLASWREPGFHSAAEPSLLDQAGVSDLKSLHRSFRRIAKFMDTDPATAISECKNVLEALSKHILTDLGQLPTGVPNMRQLNEALDEALKLSTNSVRGDPSSSRKVADDVQAAFRAVNDMRNALGTGHGGEGTGEIEPRHAKLAFNSTVAVAEFLVATWQETRRS